MKLREDRTLVCRECGKKFIFTPGEQEFYEAKQYRPPTRCRSCRMRQKQRGKPVYRGVCACCGQEALIPFPPREDRPVFCMDCYAQIQAEKRELRAEREGERA